MMTEDLRKLTVELDAARANAGKLAKSMSMLELRHGQGDVSVSFCGTSIQITRSGRETGWMPELLPQYRLLQAQLVAALKDRLLVANGAVEGLEFKIRQATRAAS